MPSQPYAADPPVAILKLDLAEVAACLAGTLELVPRGEEPRYPDLGAEPRRLTGELGK